MSPYVSLWLSLLLRSEPLYARGSTESNTRDFVRYEQALVQEALDRLRGRDPHGYWDQIRIANSAIARLLRRPAVCASGALATFVRAAECSLARLGHTIEFSAQTDRETLGEELARSARQPAR